MSSARSTEEATRLGRLLDPLRDPCFRRLAAGRAISVLGDWLLIAGLVGWVYERTGSTTHVAALMVARFVPPIAGGAVAGVLADRLPRQRLLVTSELLCGAAVAGALVGVLRGSEPLVFAGTSLCALIAPLGAVAMNALVPDVVAEGRRPAGNAALQIGQELAMAGGALAAGVTLSSGAAATALGLDLASFAVAAYLFAGIRAARVATPRRRAAHARRGDALRHIFASRSLCSVALVFPLVTLATGLTNATLPRHLTDLGLGPGGYGFGLAALAFGSALGEAAVGAVASRVGVGTLAAAAAASCLPFAALAFAPSGITAIAALGALGVMQGGGEVALLTVVQQEAAPEFRGRAFGMVSMLIRTTMLGAVAAAPVVNALGSSRHAILVSTAITAVAAAVAAARLRLITRSRSCAAIRGVIRFESRMRERTSPECRLALRRPFTFCATVSGWAGPSRRVDNVPPLEGAQSMRRRLLFITVVSVACFAFIGAGTALASGTIVFDGSPGTGAPPTTLGSHSVTQFALDPQPFSLVSGVTGPSGDVTFAPALSHRRIGQGWATWSNGYTGDVYYTNGALSATVTLPSNTSAFYFYAEPNPFQVVNITAVAQDGSSSSSGPIPVDGFAGAQFFGFYTTGTERIASITISSGRDFAIGEFGINAGAFVALGDSYSSGEGVPPFIAGTDGPGDYCHRSNQAYSGVLGTIYGKKPLFYACSGAVTSDITSTFHSTEPPQITQPGIDRSTALVTMTIGGNDAGFGDTLKACIEQKLKADAFNAAIGPIARWLGLGRDPSCAHSRTFTSSVNTRVDNVFWPVKSTELSILSSVDPKKTSVIVAGYPHLFPNSSSEQGCLELSIVLTKDDMNFMNGAGDRLIGVLQQAAGEAGVNFVDVRGAFAGHEICASGGSYLNGLSIASGSGKDCTWSVAGHCIIPGGIPIVGSFHPNAAGHANGYAAAIRSFIDSAADKTDAGFPKNPTALPDPPTTTAVPAIGFGPLVAHPVTTGGALLFAQPVTTSAADCSDTYQAGQQVEWAGDGFVPGTSVRLIAASPGPGEIQVDTATADANGHASGVARIPLSATGFTQSGAAAGTVFLDAIGLGTAVDHLDDVAMIGLAPHDSTCGLVEQLPFKGFDPPVANPPDVNLVRAGRTIPVKFSVPGIDGTLAGVLAAGYPQSAPVSCAAPEPVTSGDPTVSASDSDDEAEGDNNDDHSNDDNDDDAPKVHDRYHYDWKTDRSWRGCRTLIVKLVDGSYHRAVFQFGK